MLEAARQLDLQAIAAEPYEYRGILHSEMAVILMACREHGIEYVIESGRARAQSTYILAKYLPGVAILSIDARPEHPDTVDGVKRVEGFANVCLFSGDGAILAPALCQKVTAPRPTAVLRDGPKGLPALEVMRRCFKHPHVKLDFVHDMRRLDHGQPSIFRLAAEHFPIARFTDEPSVREELGWMDEKILAAGGPVGPAHEQEYGSYGPTVGVFFNPASITLQQQTAT